MRECCHELVSDREVIEFRSSTKREVRYDRATTCDDALEHSLISSWITSVYPRAEDSYRISIPVESDLVSYSIDSSSTTTYYSYSYLYNIWKYFLEDFLCVGSMFS